MFPKKIQDFWLVKGNQNLSISCIYEKREERVYENSIKYLEDCLKNSSNSYCENNQTFGLKYTLPNR